MGSVPCPSSFEAVEILAHNLSDYLGGRGLLYLSSYGKLTMLNGALCLCVCVCTCAYLKTADSFKGFLTKSSHIMDRALGLSNAVDILKDYTGADKGRVDGDDRSAVMSNARTFMNKAVGGRPIMDVQV